MTHLPDDPIDAGEARLARRVRDYTDPAVVPVDHAAVASTAVAAAPRRADSPGGRFGWLLAGAGLVAVVAVGAVVLNGLRGPGIGAPPSPSAAPASEAVRSCEPGSDVTGRIVSWEGAAGSRIATVTLSSSAQVACRLMDYQLALVDGAGRGQGLIVGTDVHAGFLLQPGQQASTLIQVTNYCLPVTPVEPVSIRLDSVDGGSGDLVLRPSADGLSGVPPCLGAAAPTTITQQPWQLSEG